MTSVEAQTVSQSSSGHLGTRHIATAWLQHDFVWTFFGVLWFFAILESGDAR